MREFKVGDRIKIKSWEKMEKEFGTEDGDINIRPWFVKSMRNLCGKEATIRKINDGYIKLTDWNFEGDVGWNFCSKMFERVNERDINFKVGETVRIRSWEDMAKEFGTEDDVIDVKCKFTKKMEHLCGRTAKIKELNDNRIWLEDWSNSNGELGWNFSTDMIEKFEDNQSINTYRNGNEVISELKINDEIIKTAKARCCPTDTFDFNIGAKLSLERLFEDKKEEEAKDIYIKLLSNGGFCFNQKGDILKAHKINKNGTAYVFNKDQIRSVDGCESEDWAYLKHEYEILKDYAPKDKKEIKEVKRMAKVGEYIKLTKTLFTFDEVGDILKVKEVRSDKVVVNGIDHSGLNTRTGACFELYKKSDWNYWNDSCEYVVLENYVPEKIEKTKEDDEIKAGDYIELLEENYSFDKIGMILKVNEVRNDIIHILPESYPEGSGVYYNGFVGKDGSWGYEKKWCKVLKDYVPPKQNKGRDLIGRKITAGTRFKVIKIAEDRDYYEDLVCKDEYIGKTAKFNYDFTITDCPDGDEMGIFDKKYVEAIDEENSGICWRWDEIEILD